MRNSDRCRRCGQRLIAGRAAVHLSGECATAWYQRERGRGHRRPVVGRPPAQDLTPEQIERIMARRALEQRYERARGHR